MTTGNLNTRLCKKIFTEQETCHQWLLSQPTIEILKHAYERITREDILLFLEYNELPAKRAQAILKSPCPLNDIFKTWEKMEIGDMHNIFNAVEARANAVLRQEFIQCQCDAR